MTFKNDTHTLLTRKYIKVSFSHRPPGDYMKKDANCSVADLGGQVDFMGRAFSGKKGAWVLDRTIEDKDIVYNITGCLYTLGYR